VRRPIEPEPIGTDGTCLVDHNPAPDHASGQTIRVEGINFYLLKDGRVTDIWTQFDQECLD
jgi:hypothetical protein